MARKGTRKGAMSRKGRQAKPANRRTKKSIMTGGVKIGIPKFMGGEGFIQQNKPKTTGPNFNQFEEVNPLAISSSDKRQKTRRAAFVNNNFIYPEAKPNYTGPGTAISFNPTPSTYRETNIKLGTTTPPSKPVGYSTSVSSNPNMQSTQKGPTKAEMNKFMQTLALKSHGGAVWGMSSKGAPPAHSKHI